MSRQLQNVSGETRTLQDTSGRWHVVEPDAVYSVEPGDGREFPPDTWEELPARPSKKSKSSESEAS